MRLSIAPSATLLLLVFAQASSGLNFGNLRRFKPGSNPPTFWERTQLMPAAAMRLQRRMMAREAPPPTPPRSGDRIRIRSLRQQQEFDDLSPENTADADSPATIILPLEQRAKWKKVFSAVGGAAAGKLRNGVNPVLFDILVN